MELDTEIRKSLSNIFSNLTVELTLLLCSITNEEQLDAAIEWLKAHHPKNAPSPYNVTCLKQGIKKWGNILEKQFLGDFKSKFPFITKKLEDSNGNKLIFLRMVNFLQIDPKLLAEIVEPIVVAHEMEGRQVYTVETECTSRLRTIASSPQADARAFRYVFFPNLKQSGKGAKKVYFDWRSEEERVKSPDLWKK